MSTAMSTPRIGECARSIPRMVRSEMKAEVRASWRTDGRVLAERVLSRPLKYDGPKTADDF